ncbi:hypothetical protein GEV33_002479 [Tenebrio molitor]|uniref:Uncharacterized protein n=1 Tax=Tenebrio molitor TaxID=7067 RepID=A0A8J6LIR9_TENMO|nr:hypothetical protein GEV33_002479 [Tenebrio molitor]
MADCTPGLVSPGSSLVLLGAIELSLLEEFGWSPLPGCERVSTMSG